ncbi:Por secretion system C-terminal sorting domain-containing protein [Dyadobacter soli]|uniref:Por secretion system C-terminal sorting domain-containing protein n=1 Tax=Dyadobacter soli TaxID=659014 RepID=A0A1G7YGN8_9BACT|nr:T9SS type A sorting domain-containing protein [Dyadobacter soli]SDG95415.1 Por secretion system C-terminal sorting domain-containing protein [Dyadobacter soli]
MKTFYLWACLVLAALSVPVKSLAQCELTEPAIELNSVSPSGSDCIVNINLSFTIDRNGGNKFTYVHLWKPLEYPIIDYTKKAPEAGDLKKVLATLAIDMDGAVSLLSDYSADATVIPLFAGLTILEEDLGGALSRITIENIQFPVPGACADLPILKGDVWSTQAASQKPSVHCFSKGFNLQINDPVITGKINCNEPDGPRTYDLDIITTNPTAFNVTYKLYLDDGVLTNGNTTFGIGDEEIYDSGVTSLSSSQPIHSKDEPYDYDHLEDKRTIWVVLTGPSLPNAIIAELGNGCTITLPVTLARFNGSLLDNAISLSWTTTEEAGSSHFDIERSTDAKEFIQLGRVQAKGNSAATQQYGFLDTKPFAGNNYYRLKMVDADGKFEFSRMISIDNGANSVAFELLGNPASGREIRFLLKNESASNVSLFDLSGKAVKFSLSQTGNEFTLKPKNGTSAGIYILKLQRSNAGMISKKVLMP